VFIRFGGILFLAALAIWLYCVLDALSSDRDRIRTLSKGLWVAIILLGFIVGAVAWVVWGRPRASSPRRPTLGSSGRTAWPTRPGRTDDAPANGLFGRGTQLAPDDDPEFLASLDRRAAQEHEKLLGSWEEDLRRREEELRRDRGEGDGPDGPDLSAR
jgi:hypothetical protein